MSSVSASRKSASARSAPAGRPRRELGRQHPPPLDLPGGEVRANRRGGAAVDVRAALRRRQPHRVLAELAGDDRRALGGGGLGRALEHGRELGVGPVGREREVTCARERILGELGQAAVGAAAARPRTAPGRGPRRAADA